MARWTLLVFIVFGTTGAVVGQRTTQGNNGTVQCSSQEVFIAELGTCAPADNGQTVSCNDGEVFSVDDGRCTSVFLPENMWTTSCADGQVFSAEQSMCVQGDKQTAKITCMDGEVFSADVGTCVSDDLLDDKHTVMITCMDGEVFSADQGTCLSDNLFDDKQTALINCMDGQVFSADDGCCVPDNLLGDKQTVTCMDGEVFSADDGRCVPAYLPENTWTTSCEDHEVFDLGSEECVSTTALDFMAADHCGDGEVFSMEEEECVPVSPEGSKWEASCNDEEVFSVELERCVPATAAVSTWEHFCEDDEVFNMEGEDCVQATPQDNVEIFSCGDGEVFSMDEHECVSAAVLDSKEEHLVVCEDEEALDLATGECVTVEITDTRNMATITCGDNEVFNMDGEECYNLDKLRTETEIKCGEHEFFSLAHGACFERDPDVYIEVSQCTADEIYDLGTGECWPAEFATRDNNAKAACSENEVYCLSAGRCVPSGDDCDGTEHRIAAKVETPESQEDEEESPVCGEKEVQVQVPDDGDCMSLCAEGEDEDKPMGIIVVEDDGVFDLQLCYTNTTVQQSPPATGVRDTAGNLGPGVQLKDYFTLCNPTGSDATPDPPKQCLRNPPVLVVRYGTSYAQSSTRDRPAKILTKNQEEGVWRDLRILGERLMLNQYIMIHPSDSSRGTVELDISVQNRGQRGQKRHFTIEVTDNGVDDPPTFKLQLREFVAPPVPYDLSGWTGYVVSELMADFAEDDEQSSIGAAVVLSELPSSDIGQWSVSLSGDPAQFDVLAAPSRDRRAASRKLEVLKLLGPDARLIYVPSNASYHWDNREARRKTGLKLRAWDTQGFSAGQEITFDPSCSASHECGGSNSISRRAITVAIERAGCDGRGGSGLVEDSCQKCNGDGTSCLDCNGDRDGTAEENRCNHCTGGRTGRDQSFGLDCKKKCGEYKLIQGLCVPKSTRVVADCSGDIRLLNRAFENKCGHCVGGDTGRDEDYGIHVCGSCDQTDVSCLDCDGVPNGGKVEDACGECLHPRDTSFNTGCIELSDVKPRVAKARSQTSLTVSGAGLQRIINAKCKLKSISTGSEEELEDVRLGRRSREDQAFALTFDAPAATGEYELSCDLSGRDGRLVTRKLDRENRILVIPSEGLQITGVRPDYTNAGGDEATPVTVTGEGFVNTGEAVCYTKHKWVTYQMPAVIISPTEATCSLPAMKKSVRLKIGISLEQLADRKGRDTSDYSGAWFEYRAPAPQAVSARLSDNLASVAIEFDKAIQGPEECQGLFDPTSAEKFGSSAKCRIVKGNHIVVRLGKGATLRPSDELTLKEGAITLRNSEAGESASGSVVVQGPESAVVPGVELVGPPAVDACSCLRLAARSWNTGGRDVVYGWTVDADDPSVNLTDLQTHLDGLTDQRHVRLCKDQGLLEPGKQYTFSVTVTNFLNSESAPSSHTVQTLAEVPPFTARITGSRRRQATAERPVQLRARVRTPPDSCDQDVDDLDDELIFDWEVVGSGSEDFTYLDAVGVTSATIDAGMKGGKTYSVRFTASDAAYRHIAEDTVTIEVLSRDLQPAIAGRKITIGSHQNATLDGSGSRDPDNAEGQEFFTWTCLGRDTSLPCWVEVGGEPVPLSLADEAIVNVQGSMLTPETWYTFTLTMRKGNRSASAAVDLFVSPNEVPQVEADPVPEKANPDRGVVITFWITTTLPDTTVTLECLELEGYGYVDLEEVTARGKTTWTFRKPAARKPVNVAILADSLAPNTGYTFRATAEHLGGRAYAEVVVETNGAPSPGDFQVDPAEGTAMSGTFTLSAEGWTDDEDNVLQYRFSYIGPDGRPVLLRGRDEDSQLETTLPAGTGDNNVLTLVVDVFDGRRASTRMTRNVTVNPPAEITNTTVDAVKEEVVKSLLTGDVDKAMSGMISMLKTIKKVGGNLTNAVQDVVDQLKSEVTNTLTAVVPSDEEEVANTISGLAGTFDDDSNMNEEAREKTAGYLQRVIDEFYEIATDISGEGSDEGPTRRRRKRATGSTSVTTPMTSDQVSDMLLLFDAMLASIDESSPDAVSTKLDFRSTIESGMVGMCRGQSYGGQATVAMSANVVVRTDLKLFDDIADQELLVSCDGCNGDVTGTPKIQLGTGIASAFEQWKCMSGSSTVCYGACIGSAQINFDPLTDPLSSDVIRSDLVLLDLVSPLSDLRTRLAGLRDPLELDIPATGAMPDGSYTLECRRWSGNAWTTSGCSTNPVPRDVGGVPYVSCSCSFLGGYYALFEGAYIAPTTPAPVTSPPEQKAIEFTFVQNCSVVTSDDEAGFLSTFPGFMAGKMRVSPGRVKNMALYDVAGVGCVCTYDLLEATRPEETLNFYAVDTIAELTWKRALGATSPAGTPLDIYRSSLLQDGAMVNPAKTAPIQKPASALEIIIGLLCGLFLFMVMAGLVCCFARAMVNKTKVDPETPPPSPPAKPRVAFGGV